MGSGFALLTSSSAVLGFHGVQLFLRLSMFGFSLTLGLLTGLQPRLESGQLLLQPEHLNSHLFEVASICLLYFPLGQEEEGWGGGWSDYMYVRIQKFIS